MWLPHHVSDHFLKTLFSLPQLTSFAWELSLIIRDQKAKNVALKTLIYYYDAKPRINSLNTTPWALDQSKFLPDINWIIEGDYNICLEVSQPVQPHVDIYHITCRLFELCNFLLSTQEICYRSPTTNVTDVEYWCIVTLSQKWAAYRIIEICLLEL